MAPDDILETEQAVARLAQAWKQPLIAYYVSTGPLWLKAQRLNISRRTLMRRVETAERKVAETLDSAPKT
jgi:transposase-like protein